MVFSPNLISSFFLVDPEAVKALKLKISSEITDSFIFQLVIYYVNNVKKVVKMPK
jgi:hypothetical protein